MESLKPVSAGLPLYLEVLGRRRAVVQRVRVVELPAVIGRAYSSALILDDPHVDPEHALLETDETGRIRVRDLGSLNGLQVDGRPTPSTVLRSGQVLSLGTSRVRVVLAGSSVAPAVAVGGARFERSLRSRRGALIWWGIAMILLTLGSYFDAAGTVDLGFLVSEVVLYVLTFAAWAGVWALATRLVRHAFRFMPHLGVAGCVTAIGLVASAATAYLTALFPSGWAWILEAVAFLGLSVFGLAGHLRFTSDMSRRRALGWSAGVLAGLGAITFAISTSEEDSGPYGALAALKPIPTVLVPTTPLDAFVTEASEDVRRELDQMPDD